MDENKVLGYIPNIVLPSPRMTVKALRAKLVEIGKKRGLRALARKAELSYDTVLNIRDGVTPSPRALTVEALEKAIEKTQTPKTK